MMFIQSFYRCFCMVLLIVVIPSWWYLISSTVPPKLMSHPGEPSRSCGGHCCTQASRSDVERSATHGAEKNAERWLGKHENSCSFCFEGNFVDIFACVKFTCIVLFGLDFTFWRMFVFCFPQQKIRIFTLCVLDMFNHILGSCFCWVDFSHRLWGLAHVCGGVGAGLWAILWRLEDDLLEVLEAAIFMDSWTVQFAGKPPTRAMKSQGCWLPGCLGGYTAQWKMGIISYTIIRMPIKEPVWWNVKVGKIAAQFLKPPEKLHRWFQNNNFYYWLFCELVRCIFRWLEIHLFKLLYFYSMQGVGSPLAAHVTWPCRNKPPHRQGLHAQVLPPVGFRYKWGEADV